MNLLVKYKGRPSLRSVESIARIVGEKLSSLFLFSFKHHPGTISESFLTVARILQFHLIFLTLASLQWGTKSSQLNFTYFTSFPPVQRALSRSSNILLLQRAKSSAIRIKKFGISAELVEVQNSCSKVHKNHYSHYFMLQISNSLLFPTDITFLFPLRPTIRNFGDRISTPYYWQQSALHRISVIKS